MTTEKFCNVCGKEFNPTVQGRYFQLINHVIVHPTLGKGFKPEYWFCGLRCLRRFTEEILPELIEEH